MSTGGWHAESGVLQLVSTEVHQRVLADPKECNKLRIKCLTNYEIVELVEG